MSGPLCVMEGHFWSSENICGTRELGALTLSVPEPKSQRRETKSTKKLHGFSQNPEPKAGHLHFKSKPSFPYYYKWLVSWAQTRPWLEKRCWPTSRDTTEIEWLRVEYKPAHIDTRVSSFSGYRYNELATIIESNQYSI